MKPVDKKDLPKLVALIVAALGLIGFALFQFTAGSSATPPPAEGNSNPKPTPSPAPTPLALTADLLQGSVLGGRDPFTPLGGAAPKDKPLVIPPIPQAEKSGPLPAPVAALRSLLGGAAPGAPSGEGEVKPAEVQPPPPPPSLSVTGVIVAEPGSGVPSIAILRNGDERKFVRVGDPVGNNFQVTAIRLDGIEIADPTTDRRETVNLSK